MDNKTKKTYKGLKEFALFCEDFESFKALFFDNLDKSKKDDAIELLLMVNFELLKSEGEKFNELLNAVDERKKETLILWLNDAIKRLEK